MEIACRYEGWLLLVDDFILVVDHYEYIERNFMNNIVFLGCLVWCDYLLLGEGDG
jgi:hypothetical protein